MVWLGHSQCFFGWHSEAGMLLFAAYFLLQFRDMEQTGTRATFGTYCVCNAGKEKKKAYLRPPPPPKKTVLQQLTHLASCLPF